MGYRYFIAPINVRCEECDLPSPEGLHYSQQGSIYQCDKCDQLFEFKIGRRGKHFWFATEPELVADKIGKR